jgi:hypothetical protein
VSPSPPLLHYPVRAKIKLAMTLNGPGPEAILG